MEARLETPTRELEVFSDCMSSGRGAEAVAASRQWALVEQLDPENER